ncbi:MAG: hypothetical protein ACLR2G_06220 [Phascolarctobacterium faecium]
MRGMLRDSGSTIWDQACGTHIEAEPVGRLRYILFAIVFLCSLPRSAIRSSCGK